MIETTNGINLALSGGGVKGVAFAGVYEVICRMGIKLGNIAGVSAGAMAGAFIAAGYSPKEFKKTIEEFDFGKINTSNIPKNIPVVERYIEFYRENKFTKEKSIETFLKGQNKSKTEFLESRGEWLNNIIKYSKEGCLFDGDYLEKWIFKVLKNKGIKTFRDLRGGVADKINPEGYKLRMTAVDANRAEIIVLPDDIKFYDIEPDNLEVSKAIRMSTSVPFVFKPVPLKKKVNDGYKTHYIVDGGIFDNFPFWLLDNLNQVPIVGFRLDGGDKTKISIDAPLSILKALIMAVHDVGIPKIKPQNLYFTNIDTSNVPFLDFNLSQDEKQYLYNQGKDCAEKFYEKNFKV